jgi:hypothetical protein
MSSNVRKLRRVGKQMKQPKILTKEEMEAIRATAEKKAEIEFLNKKAELIKRGNICCVKCGMPSGMRGVTLKTVGIGENKQTICQRCL